MAEKKRPRTHFIPEYFGNPVHPLTVDLVGCGGNGSIMLSCLASIHSALTALGKQGLQVTAYDDDEVSEANLGRQLFSPSDLYLNKADVLVTRFNRVFGLTWKSVPEKYKFNPQTNIIISCTDNIQSRKYISKMFNRKEETPANPSYGQADENRNYYWLDLGNTQSTGQAVLGSRDIKQPHSVKFESVSKLPTITELYRLTGKDDENSGPSCSLAEALEKQDLFINRAVATEAADILWKLLRNGHIEIHGFYKNISELRTVPIEI